MGRRAPGGGTLIRGLKPRLALVCLAALALTGLLIAVGTGSVRRSPRIYWGAYASGGPYGLVDAPWDMRSLARFERDAGKRVSLLEWGQAWFECSSDCGLRPFRSELMQKARDHGAIPVLSWDSQHEGAGASDPQFSLGQILSGRYDAFLRRWALDARRWGHPFFLRFDWEMNTYGVPYGERSNGNRPGQFVRVWRHVHDIFRHAGATNVTWVWCPNVQYPGSLPLRELYPGDAYVDWTCLDGYNWGTNPAKPQGWNSFDQTFGPTYHLITGSIAPRKPMIIGETASSEWGGSKARWITQALAAIPARYPKIRAVVWFNKNADGMDWVIESSASARRAFAAAIAARPYVGNSFGRVARRPLAAP